MELLYSIIVGGLAAAGVYLLLRGRTFPVVVGLTLLSYAVNLFLFAAGRLATGLPAVIGHSETYADPLPQALVLTAIVIGFALTALAVILALAALSASGHDGVDDEKEQP